MRNRFILIYIMTLVGLPLTVYSQKKEYRILFVGNSLTYSNDLPFMVAELAMADSVRISYSSVALPGYSLEDHWKEGRVEDEIQNGHYDYVILQQGPSALDESRVLLIEYTKRFAEVCKKTKAKPVLFMVWPSKARSFDLDRVIYNYTEAARQTGCLLAPAGLAWKLAWERNPNLPFYSGDNFHPSALGSKISALVIYGRLRGIVNVDLGKLISLAIKDMGSPDMEILGQAIRDSLLK